jgi:PleD family two-component response regulator
VAFVADGRAAAEAFRRGAADCVVVPAPPAEITGRLRRVAR